MDPANLPEVVYRRGVQVLGSDLWFDPTARRVQCFASSAHQRRVGRHRQVICTDDTARLLRARGNQLAALTAPYGQRMSLGRSRIELIPSGRLLGAAMLWGRVGDAAVLYAGAVTTHPLPTAAPLDGRAADLVIVSADSVRAAHHPSHADATAALLAAVDDALSAGRVPALLVDELGQGQDVARLLGTAGHTVRVQRSVYRNALLMRKAGVRFPRSLRFDGRVEEGEVLIYARRYAGAAALARLPGLTVIDLTYDPPSPAAEGGASVEHVIPWGARSDAGELLDWLETLEPSLVVLFGEGDRELKALCGARGLAARALSEAGQMALGLTG